MFRLELGGVWEKIRRALNAPCRALAGAAFVALAMASIEYDEFVAPQVERLSDGWSGVALDLGRRLTALAP